MKIAYLAVTLILFTSSCDAKHTQGSGSRLSLVSKSNSLKVSDIKISVQVKSDYSAESSNPKVLVWDGKEEKTIPDYGIYGAIWFINYKDSVYGEFVHSKIITNDPLEYKFLINRNPDNSVFFQYNIPQRGGDSGERIKLKP